MHLSIRYTERLAEAGIPSVGSKGDSYDNDLAEFWLFKTEVIRQEGPWRGLEEVEFATLDWVCWYNKKRFSQCYIPPVEFEQMYYLNQPATEWLESTKTVSGPGAFSFISSVGKSA